MKDEEEKRSKNADDHLMTTSAAWALEWVWVDNNIWSALPDWQCPSKYKLWRDGDRSHSECFFSAAYASVKVVFTPPLIIACHSQALNSRRVLAVSRPLQCSPRAPMQQSSADTGITLAWVSKQRKKIPIKTAFCSSFFRLWPSEAVTRASARQVHRRVSVRSRSIRAMRHPWRPPPAGSVNNASEDEKKEKKTPRLSIPQPIIFHGPAPLLHHQTASFPPRPRSLPSTGVLISALHITGGCPYKIRYGSNSFPTSAPQLCWGPTDVRPSAPRVCWGSLVRQSRDRRSSRSWKRGSPGTHNKSCSVLFCPTPLLEIAPLWILTGCMSELTGS